MIRWLRSRDETEVRRQDRPQDSDGSQSETNNHEE